MAEFHTPRKDRTTTHTFHIACPRCGSDITISNAEDTSAISLEYRKKLMFNCPECGASIPLPYKDFTKDGG